MVHTRKKGKLGEIVNIPYADEVSFYANPKTKEIVHFRTKFLGKGWYAIYKNNKLVKKTRNPSYTVPSNFKKVSLFTEMSFHSSLSKTKKGGRGGFGNYGTKDYTLDFSSYNPLGKYKLKSPVKSQLKNQFGKEVSSVQLQKWNYIALNWIPEDDKIKLQIQHSKHTPFKKKKVYESKKYDMKDKKQAIKDFKKYVSKHK